MFAKAVVLAAPDVITPVASDAKFRVPVAAIPLATAVEAVVKYWDRGVVASAAAAKA